MTLTLLQSAAWGFCSIPHLGLVSRGYTEVVRLREAARG